MNPRGFFPPFLLSAEQLEHHPPCRHPCHEELDVALALTHLHTWHWGWREGELITKQRRHLEKQGLQTVLGSFTVPKCFSQASMRLACHLGSEHLLLSVGRRLTKWGPKLSPSYDVRSLKAQASLVLLESEPPSRWHGCSPGSHPSGPNTSGGPSK